MKLNILLIAAILLSGHEASAGNRPDTISNVHNASRLVITESPSGAAIKITRNENGDSISELISRSFDGPVTLEQRKWHSTIGHEISPTSNWDLCFGGPGIGWISSVGQPDGTGLEMGKSLEVSWLNMFSLNYTLPSKNSKISIGFGFDWRNYRISTGATRFVTTDDGGVAIAPYPEGVTAHGSRLKVFSMGVPVLWGQAFPLRTIDGSKFFMSAGAVLNYSSHGSLLTEWTDADGNKVKMKSNHIGHRRFSVDFIALAKIGWGLNLYVRYSPQTVLKGANQPHFRPFSTGLILYY